MVLSELSGFANENREGSANLRPLNVMRPIMKLTNPLLVACTLAVALGIPALLFLGASVTIAKMHRSH